MLFDKAVMAVFRFSDHVLIQLFGGFRDVFLFHVLFVVHKKKRLKIQGHLIGFSLIHCARCCKIHISIQRFFAQDIRNWRKNPHLRIHADLVMRKKIHIRRSICIVPDQLQTFRKPGFLFENNLDLIFQTFERVLKNFYYRFFLVMPYGHGFYAVFFLFTARTPG